MSARLYRVIVPVSDMDRAAEFYGAIFATPGERVSGGRHYFDCGGVILACVDPRGDNPAAEFRPNPDHIYFAVPDLDSVFARAQDAGCAWLEATIATRPWGERCFYARDPFGNPICLVDESTLFTGGRFVP
jgi:predicted enzyme related to lactoylglutathione lyase